MEGEDDEQFDDEQDGEGEEEVEDIGEELGDQVEKENEETESSEQVDSGTNGNESVGKTSKRKNHRGKKRSKGKNKLEGSEAAGGGDGAAKTTEDIKQATAASKPATTRKMTASKKNSENLAASLLGSMANDPLLKGILAGSAKPPNPSLRKAFTQSPLYNTSGSGPALDTMLSSLQKPSHTPVLGAPSSIWAGNEHLKPEGRRDPKTGAHRAAWPELSEMKAEGQYRKEAGKERRLPLPRRDMMNKEAVIREAGGQEVADMLSEEGVDAVVRDLMKETGEEIAWQDRGPVVFSGFDRLEIVEKERREENARREEGEPVCGPITHGHGYGHGTQGVAQRGHGPNMGLRGGFSQSGPGRRYTGAPPPVLAELKPKVVQLEAISYGTNGPGDGKVPPPGGWVFYEEFLKQKGDWEDLLENHL
ncbi:hypothetical protein L207DRAFT_508562 [Hyaloscypha variabilis F]|uniref:Uncharacterized protein n=1 Tax=Hyaloscypha variabilis (strain UAMH 11265 / GT02V1 / F) TaxID=1149755 RepID=A0A2J6S4V2_HYAVF|nr:hypothetical protein L207DRAFT_508562 [Hyaloscypha variabilis F]